MRWWARHRQRGEDHLAYHPDPTLCLHAYSAVKRKTTTRPRTQAGVDLYSLAQALLEVTTFDQAVAWMSKLATWNTTYKEFLAQRTRLPDGRWLPPMPG